MIVMPLIKSESALVKKCLIVVALYVIEYSAFGA